MFMKKSIIISLLSLLFCLSANAKISFSGVDNIIGVAQENIDTVLVAETTENLVLKYNVEEASTVNWYTYTKDAEELTLVKTDENVTESTLDAVQEASIGYVIKVSKVAEEPSVDGEVEELSEDSEEGSQEGAEEGSQDVAQEKIFWAWVFDHSKHNLQLGDIQVNTELEDRCKFYQLNFDIQADAFQYDTLGHDRAPFEVERQFTLSYDSTYYAEGTWVSDSIEYNMPLVSDYSVPSPLQSTTYKLKGDNFLIAWNKALEVETDLIPAFAVAVEQEYSVRIRENATNELNRDNSTEVKLSGSAPLNVELINNASPSAFFFDWCISTDKEYNSCNISASTKDFRYTFEKQGTYYLKSEITNSQMSEDSLRNCMVTKTIIVEVLNSNLDVPNVFSPNGDGVNDEFKVAYQSLTSFRARVYSIHGRLLHEWTDPSKGWDGTIGGNPAAEGTYFYIIEATGDDYDEDGKQIKYFKKGDINLLR
jgi:gliding motility-associated-like protein